MATSRDVLRVLKEKERRTQLVEAAKHTQRCKNDGEVHALLAELEKYIEVDQKAYASITSDHGIYNWLRTRLFGLKDAIDILQILRIDYEHDLCQYTKSFLLKGEKVDREIVMAASSRARRDLLKYSDDITEEQLLQWLRTYIRREAFITRFTTFWTTNHRMLYGMAFSITRRHEPIEDLLQITFEKGLRFIRNIQNDKTFPEEEQLKAWISRIMRNAFIDTGRENIPDSLDTSPEQLERIEVALEGEVEQPEEMFLKQEMHQEIQSILRQLNPSDREVLKLHLMNGLKAAEIAQELGKEEEAIRSQLKRLRPKILVKLQAKDLRDYLNKRPNAQRRLNQLVREYVAKGADAIWVHTVLSLHVAGNDVYEIAALVGNQEESAASQIAAVQDCLKTNLPHLFKLFYRRA